MPKFFSKRIGLNLRKAKRFSAEDLKIRVFVKPQPDNLEIADVSRGGISFFYSGPDNIFPERFEVKLYDGKDFQLGKVTLKKISDEVFSEIPNEDLIIRRLRGRFIRISVVQEYDLNKYLDKIKTP